MPIMPAPIIEFAMFMNALLQSLQYTGRPCKVGAQKHPTLYYLSAFYFPAVVQGQYPNLLLLQHSVHQHP